MASKRKTRKTKRQRRQRRQTHRKRQTHQRHQTHQKRQTHRRVISGGNYERDFTSRTMFNIPIKAANKVVAAVPGFGVMSAAALIKLNENLDRNGKHFYD